MTRPADAPFIPDWRRLAGQIIEDAQVTLGVPLVILTQYDKARRMTRTVGWGGLRLHALQRAMALVQRLVPSYDPLDVELPVAQNRYVRAIFLDGRHEIVVAPTHLLIEGVAPPLVAQIAARVAGAAYGVVIPLLVEGEAIGTITCFQAHPDFGGGRLATAQAFARQVALSIHNAVLLERHRAAAEALEQSRLLLIEAQNHTRQEISELLHSRVQSRLLVAWHQLGEVRALSEDGRRQVEAVRHTLERLREDDVRRLSHQLHPEGLQAGLLPAIQVLASTLHGGLQVQLAVNTALLDADLPGTGAAGTARGGSVRGHHRPRCGVRPAGGVFGAGHAPARGARRGRWRRVGAGQQARWADPALAAGTALTLHRLLRLSGPCDSPLPRVEA